MTSHTAFMIILLQRRIPVRDAVINEKVVKE